MTGRSIAFAIALAAALTLSSCGGKGRSASPASNVRKFPPAPSVPSMITGAEAINEYLATHFWDAFLDGAHACDSNLVNGVPAEEVEKAFGMYVNLLERSCPFEFAQNAVGGLFKAVEKFEEKNPSSNVYEYFGKMASKFFYDPNSPTRDEDLYLPYLRGMAGSGFTPEDMKPSLSNDIRLCSLNRRGTPAADIVFTDRTGKRRNLYGIKAGHILLFFSNPGCPACKEIIGELTENTRINSLVASSELTVVNLYIDLDRDAWQLSSAGYPKEWINGYDQDYAVRTDETYSVRAIPSLYLLDKDKKVIMKDAPTEKVLAYLEKL